MVENKSNGSLQMYQYLLFQSLLYHGYIVVRFKPGLLSIK